MGLNEEFIIIKVLKDNIGIIKTIKESLEKGIKRIYNVNNYDQACIEKFKLVSEIKIAFILFDKDGSKYEPYEISVGKGRFFPNPKNNINFNLEYEIDYTTKSKIIIDNFVLSAGIDLKDDYSNLCYIITETSISLYRKLLDSLTIYEVDPKYLEEQDYKDHMSDPKGKLSQRNFHCLRNYKNFDDSQIELRSEFQRDRERILHSKAFRRLVDKAQIFTSKKGDHFRTRMTHTLEVAQISRGISRQLNLNEDLTEAIALAHDIGHTPFGHQGERTLQLLLDEEIKKLPKDMQNNRRFKHNFQGLRVLSYLEEKYVDFEGLNLSYQVLEGVLKHTKCCPKGKECKVITCDHSCINMDEFLKNGKVEQLFLQYRYPTTLEGQVVRIADEIAQRGHDLDDAFASKLLLFSEFERICGIKKLLELKELAKKASERANNKELEGFYFIDKDNVIRAELVSAIIGFMMKDIVQNSLENIQGYDEMDELFIKNGRIKELLIDFKKETKFIVEYLENEISKKVINSHDVVMFDNTSEKIIKTLFKAYLYSPKLLPDAALRRLFKEIKKSNLDVIDFRDSEISLITKELDRIRLYPFNKMVDDDANYAKKYDLLLHCIIDHISGMTDNYAINEYHKIIGF